MGDHLYYGTVYHFDNEFTKPRRYGFINLIQTGELQCGAEYVVENHIQVCHEISYIISGFGTFHCDGRTYEVEPGDLILNCQNEVHSIQSAPCENLRYLYLGFLFDPILGSEPSIAPLVQYYNSPGETRLCKDTWNCWPLLHRLISEFYSGAAFSELSIQSLLQGFLILVYRNFHKESIRPFVPPRSADVAGNTVYSVIRYIESHAADIADVKELATALGYSCSYLSHLFRERTGNTLQGYLTKKKIAFGIVLMKGERHSVTEIAALLGYDTLQSFSKAFRRITGCCPTEYKNTWKKLQCSSSGPDLK